MAMMMTVAPTVGQAEGHRGAVPSGGSRGLAVSFFDRVVSAMTPSPDALWQVPVCRLAQSGGSGRSPDKSVRRWQILASGNHDVQIRDLLTAVIEQKNLRLYRRPTRNQQGTVGPRNNVGNLGPRDIHIPNGTRRSSLSSFLDA
jgi:hypothetical protein